MRHGKRWLILGLVCAPLGVIPAQDTTLANPPPAPTRIADGSCGFCHRPSVPAALFEGFLVSASINRFNAWVLSDSTARVTPRTWRNNLEHRWGWDEDDFLVNMLGHPYNGSLYFAAARSNGLSYWAAVPLTFFGSVSGSISGKPPSLP